MIYINSDSSNEQDLVWKDALICYYGAVGSDDN